MKKSSIIKRLKSWMAAPVIIALSALALVFYAPGAAFSIDESEWEYEADEGYHQEEWYDPSDWFDEPGGGVSYESDWYDYTYGYDDSYDDDVYGYGDYDPYGDGVYGYYDYEPYEGDVYGDYGDDIGFEDDYDYDYYDYDYDYYTDDWYEEEDIF